MYLAGVSAMAFQITEQLDRYSRIEEDFDVERAEPIVARFIEKLPEGTIVPGDTLGERAKWLITSALAERGIAAPEWKWPVEPLVGQGLEHVPPEELYDARTAQLERRPWRGRTGEKKAVSAGEGHARGKGDMKDYEATDDQMGAVPNEIERLKAIVLVRTMESENALLPDTVIITVQNDPNTHFKPHIGESWRAQVNQFRNPEHLAEALAEPAPDLIEAVRTARRELVIVLWDAPGRTLAWTVSRS
jgi:hypothetical protein